MSEADPLAEFAGLPQLVDLRSLEPYAANARTHSPEQIEQIKESFRRFGFVGVVAYDESGLAIGHGRQLAALEMWEAGEIVMGPGKREPLPAWHAPAVDISGLSDDERRALIIADNKLALNAGWDEATLRAEIEALAELDFDMPVLGFDEAELKRLIEGEPDGAARGGATGGLANEFLIPPFSVLNAREGWWQDRKRQWIALGIESEVGRGENLLRFSDTLKEPDPVKRAAPKSYGTQAWVQDTIGDDAGLSANQSGTSIFDPVLCELVYRWFAPKGGRVLDPFAGGSVRGIVAAALGRAYTGIDLRPEQIEANAAQWPAVSARLPAPIEGEALIEPVWLAGDSSDLLSAAPEAEADQVGEGHDLVFSCPPYGDLEVYSDDPADISTLSIAEFDIAYERIIRRAIARLADNRFACFVVGDYRDKRGFYANFVAKTIDCFQRNGALLYNEIILLTAIGSLPIRMAKQFRSTRKCGKTHQNVLVFCKGDPRKATEACGPVDCSAALAEVEPDDESGAQTPPEASPEADATERGASGGFGDFEVVGGEV